MYQITTWALKDKFKFDIDNKWKWYNISYHQEQLDISKDMDFCHIREIYIENLRDS